MEINITGLATPGAPEDRVLAYLAVTLNGEVYNWSLFVPAGQELNAYLESRKPSIEAEILAKEAVWQALDPKTREIPPMFPGEDPIVVPIDKSEIVCPDMPDYYALRRSEYPSLSDQMDAFWKGTDSQAYQDMQARIQAVKSRYPKPTY